MVPLLLLAVLGLVVFYAWRPLLNYCTALRYAFRTPTASGALPLIGHAHKAFKDNIELFQFICDVSSDANKGDGICKLWLGPVPVYVITDGEAYKNIANTCLDKNYIYKYLEMFMGGSVLTANASLWKQRVKVVKPAFNSKEIGYFLDVFNKQSRPFVKDLERRVGCGPFEDKPMLNHLSFKIIFQTAFGLTLEEENIDSHEYKRLLLQAKDNVMKRLTTPWLHCDFLFNISSLGRASQKVVANLHETSLKVLNRAKATYFKGDIDSGDEARPFLGLLLNNLAIGSISDDHMRAELDTIIVTGFESVATALLTTLVLLGAHPEAQEKVYTELKEIFGDSERDVTKTDLTQMVYLEAAIRESLRVYPLAPITGRTLDRDMQFKQYNLPAGATVFILHWGMNRHPCWGDDVVQYKPERWLDQSKLPGAVIQGNTFGIGIRACIGKTYAMTFLKTILTHILRKYKITASTENVKFEIAIGIQPVSGFDISIELR